MKKNFVLISFIMLVFNSAKGATVNCSNGECEFLFSHHYDYAKTTCLQTLSYEDVETQILYFKILKTGEHCKVYESN